VRIWFRVEGIAGSKNRSCIKKKMIIRSRPMKLASSKKALSSGFMTSKSITRTATVPYLFIQRFMRLIPSAGDESKDVAVQVALQVLSAR
jgi:hypothetical protein